MANSSPPWATYCALMLCHLVTLDKRPRVRPVGIGETLHRALDKLVMRAAGDQAKTSCGNLQLCAGLEARIEGYTHAVEQRQQERVQEQLSEEDAADDMAEEEEEEEVGGIAAGLNFLTIETEGTEEEAAEQLKSSLEMEVEEVMGSEGEEEGGGTQSELGAL